MKRLLLILAVAGITDLPGCYVCAPEKIGSTVNFREVTWPAGVSLPPDLVPYATAHCTERGWTLPTVDAVPPFDFARLPPPVQVPNTGSPTVEPPRNLPEPYVFPTNVPVKPAVP